MDETQGGLPAGLAALMKGPGSREDTFLLRAEQAVFLIVDMQNFVCDPIPNRALLNIKRVIERTNLLADFCHEKHIPVIWLRQCFTKADGADDVGLYRLFHKDSLGPGMFGQGEESQISPEMHYIPGRDFIIEKNRYSAFAPGSSRLESLLKGLGRNQIILGGAATNVCVESTARDAMQRGYQVTVLTDATTTFNDLVQQVSLLNIKLFFGDIKSVDSAISELQASIKGL